MTLQIFPLWFVYFGGVDDHHNNVETTAGVHTFAISEFKVKSKIQHIAFAFKDGSTALHLLRSTFKDPWENEAHWMENFLCKL